MTATARRFVCLDPRKAKRRAVATALAGLGPIRWLKVGPMRLRGYPETAAEAQTALNMSKDRDRGPLLARLNRWLFALQYNGARAYFEAHPDAVAVCWNGLNGTRRAFMQGARHAGARLLFFELAPLPGRVTIDPNGVNFANSLPRDIAPYLAWAKAEHPAPDAWRSAGRDIRQRAPMQAKATTGDLPPLDAPFLFVPLQTPGDSQLRLFGGAFPKVDSFIDALVAASAHLPEGWHIRVKEHPTAPTSFADKFAGLTMPRIFLDNATDTFTQVAASRGVITVNSSVGLESMFYDKPVVACGQCFWAIPGVADSAPTPQALNDFCGHPGALGYDPVARDAFMNFLTQCYYPEQASAAPLVAARLQGPDSFGFWQVAP